MIEFSKDELLAIEHCLTPSEVSANPDSSGFLPNGFPTKEMRLKVGKSLVEHEISGKSIGIEFVEIELWILTERIDIYMETPLKRIGLEIKVKVYQDLLRIKLGDNILEKAFSAKEV